MNKTREQKRIDGADRVCSEHYKTKNISPETMLDVRENYMHIEEYHHE